MRLNSGSAFQAEVLSAVAPANDINLAEFQENESISWSQNRPDGPKNGHKAAKEGGIQRAEVFQSRKAAPRWSSKSVGVRDSSDTFV
jgi:hypothetical protein